MGFKCGRSEIWTCGSHLDFHGHLSGTCLTPGDDAMPNHSCSRPSWETRRPGGRPHASTPAGRDAGGAPGWDSLGLSPPPPLCPFPAPWPVLCGGPARLQPLGPHVLKSETHTRPTPQQAIPLPGFYPKTQARSPHRHWSPRVASGFICNSPKPETIQLSTQVNRKSRRGPRRPLPFLSREKERSAEAHGHGHGHAESWRGRGAGRGVRALGGA